MGFPCTLSDMVPAVYSFDGEGVCKGCGNDIEWWTTPTGKKIPMNPMPGSKDAATAHWTTCEEADSFRRKA